MHLWLMRHGEAVTPDEARSDHERPLSERGRRQVTQLGLWLCEHERPPDRILHSPLRRACETALVLHGELGANSSCEESPILSPGLQCDLLLARLASHPDETAVCVGHQPDIGRCLAEMIGGGRCSLPPGAIAGIEFPHVITPGGGHLRWLLTPDWFG